VVKFGIVLHSLALYLLNYLFFAKNLAAGKILPVGVLSIAQEKLVILDTKSIVVRKT
jgi:hypothetical protein